MQLLPLISDIFSQISDATGQLIHWKLCEFLREILALPAAVYESPTFHYHDGLENDLFPMDTKVSVNDFITSLISEPGPPCLVWMPLLQRFSAVENIVHPTICSVCHRENFTGFRYRCQVCTSYQLCQDCFWHGRVSLSHRNDHEVREYATFKSPSKQIGHTLRKSFRCVPEKSTDAIPRFPELPEKTLNLSHIVPPSPLPSHNGFFDSEMFVAFDRGSTIDSRATAEGSCNGGQRSTAGNRSVGNDDDEEHQLIARYAARLAQENRSPCEQPSPMPDNSSRAQRELIAQLETKNKEIQREIERLRRQQDSDPQQHSQSGSGVIDELRALRQRKDELEGHLGTLQDSRRHLMVQLESLMKMLKSQQTVSSPPKSTTPNTSPRSGKSPPIPQG